MCGICGFTGFKNEEILKKMSEILTHRGPDEKGFYIKDEISLAHRRLSIIDIKTGHQPMTNEDQTLWIAYNGEIYNFLDLKADLRKKHHFKTNSDTEVILHAYEEWGKDCFSKFNGMFALALYDEKHKELILARDHAGIKPLYYALGPKGNLFFASEIKALLLAFKKEINFKALDQYLTFRSINGEETIFKGILALLPGKILIYKDKKLNFHSFWNLEVKPSHKNYFELIEEFYFLLEDSVKKQLISDVPLGVFLSGGLDSTLIAALMKKNGQDKIKTFSVGFGNYYDELPQARKIADFLGAEHTEIVIKEEDLKALPKIVWHLDQPLGDAIIVPIYYLSGLAGKSVKVVLTGEGGDELLGGYIHQRAIFLAETIYNKFPILFKKIFFQIFKLLPLKFLNYFFNYPSFLGFREKERILSFIKNLEFKDSDKHYLSLISLFNEIEKEELYSESFSNLTQDKAEFEKEENLSLINKILLREYKSWLPDNILFKQDRLAMANSLEARVPYLDPRLIKLVLSFPDNLKIKNLKEKFLIKNKLKEFFPRILIPKKKQAFHMPIESHFQNVFWEQVEEYLSPERIKKRGYFKYEYIKNLKEKFSSAPLIYSKQLMALIILEIWHEVFGL
ncbi:MAG: asparagine synthase (glutamine-hydrolyzing) [Armatimonadetes bacterium]|nr:asparagine synthase (glutamine-hydrolyzing) [Armatimonadota bacterium]